ncbi:histidine kinase [Deinococcus sp.]|uniref:sensor histidine kinase n=1 Tax=Deinococcus sp. TaxID=47478 RepID=UPI0025F94453|nr:histidine kinase [Deinococcus sp.]
MVIPALARRPDVASFLNRPRVGPVVAFVGLGILTSLLESLVIRQGGEATLPLSDVRVVLGRVLFALLWFGSVLWAIRPGVRSTAEQVLLGLSGLAIAVFVIWADRPSTVLLVLPIVARYFLLFRPTLMFFGALLVLSVLLEVGLSPSLPAGDPQLLVLVILTLTQAGFGYAAFEYMLRNEEQKLVLSWAYQEVRASQNAQVQQVLLEERTTISRELHDSLGHELAAIRLEIQRARRLEQKSVDASAPVLAALDSAMLRSSVAQERLQEVVFALKPAQLDGTLFQALGELVKNWPERISLHLPPSEPALPVATTLVLFRAVQEAMTNAHKYAPGQPVAITLEHAQQTLSLTITNRQLTPLATRPAVQSSRTGTGLRTMQERLALLGGSASSEATEDVFTLRVALPFGKGA